ncbi:hypothetical protein BSKO_06609 [Bryopsis sp. KO-2023]|nr:hypothetical protein BSKO_06609 [Bryopsis sp. KO-2023]
MLRRAAQVALRRRGNWTEVLHARAFAAASGQDPFNSLKVADIVQLLHDGNIDFRDCYEKAELVERLRGSMNQLPVPVRNRLRLLTDPSGSEPDPSIPTPFPNQHLFPDEQYVVKLFNESRRNVAHITSFRSQPYYGFSLNPVEIPAGTGSGFVWDEQGHVVTNLHVVEGQSRVQITLSDNKKFDAEVKGSDPEKDLAVLKIDPGKQMLMPVQVGLSSNLQVGQRVFAIGNPFGLDQTLTAGIISGLGREIEAQGTGRKIRDVIQTDAAINPGNSGGPLLDSQGRLVGVNTAIVSPGSGTFAGIGFAIPSNTVRRIVKQIIRHGRIVKPRLGLAIASDVQGLTLYGKNGIVIINVDAGSPAHNAGLRGVHQAAGQLYLGDVIVSVGGQEVTNVEEFLSTIEEFDVGDLVPLTVDRHDPSTGRSELKDVHVRTVAFKQ